MSTLISSTQTRAVEYLALCGAVPISVTGRGTIRGQCRLA